jgi:hypothetical protein
LLDAIEWPAGEGTPAAPTGKPSSRLAVRWLAGTVFVAMTASCSSSGLKLKPPSSSDAQVLQDSAAPAQADAQGSPAPDTAPDEFSIKQDAPPIILPDAWVPPSYDVSDAYCDTRSLGQQVALATRTEICNLAASPAYANTLVVLDGEGRAVDLLTLPDRTPVLSGSARQAWLDAVANMRWPCLAGQEAAFSCAFLLY